MLIPNLPLNNSRVEVLPDRKSWKEARTLGHRIGGSDVAQILDRSPHGGPWSFWNERINPTMFSDMIENAEQSRGKRYENRVLEDYSTDYGVNVWLPKKLVGAGPSAEVVIHGPEWWMAATPDAFVYDPVAASWGGGEAKTSALPDLWGPECEIPKWNEVLAKVVPVHISIQVYWYLAITDLPWWDLPVLIISQSNSGLQLRRYRFYADPAIQKAMVQVVSQWRDTHLIGRTPPAINGESDCRNWLGLQFGKTNVFREPTPAELALAGEYVQLKGLIKEYTTRAALIENHLLAAMGEADGLYLAGDPADKRRPALRRVVVGAHDVKEIPARRQAAHAYLKAPNDRNGK